MNNETILYKLEIGLICCKGGGGGGSSGAVSHSAYLESVHGDWLNQSGADTITESITDVMNAALGNSPFTTLTAYNPDADLTNMIAEGNDLQTLVTLLSTGTTLDTLITNVLDDTRIDTAVNEYSDDLAARLTAEVLPRFESGMRDINAVTSSAFAVGRAIIEEGQTRQVARYSAELHLKAFSDDAIKVISLKLEYQRAVSAMLMEAYRMKIVAKKEEADVNRDIDQADALWDLEVFQYGSNLLAGISGGIAGTSTHKPSKAASALGGALAGAAAGAKIGGGNPYVTAAGAVIGAAAGLMD